MTQDARTTRRACPEPDVLAAHAEGRLDGDEAARTDAHIAHCPVCFEVFAETVRQNLDEEGEAAVPPGEAAVRSFLGRRRGWITAGLAVAALVLIALPLGLQRWARPASSALVSELAAAIGPRRFVEPRVTGGFQHARLTVLRSDDARRGLDAETPAVLATIARIRERAESDPSPEALAALGVTYLVSGDATAAVAALEAASAQAPEDARLLSDLAAAYLAQAAQADAPADLPRALEAAERAVALPEAPDEAWFNRALALESLHLTDAARAAWQDYLARDAASGWAGEARERLERLPRARQSSAEEDATRVRAAIAAGPPAVERLADAEPGLLRDHLEKQTFPAWAEAQIVGRPEATHQREEAFALGEALGRATGDLLLRDTARALVEPAAATARDPLRSQALGHRALAEAQRRYARHEASCDGFREAHRELQAGGSPAAARARLYATIACLYPSEPQSALAELAALASLAEPRAYLQLLGRIHWMQGLIHGVGGNFGTSLEHYQSALAKFRAGRDAGGEAGVLVALSEVFQLAGEGRTAWRYRLLALGQLDAPGNPRRQFMLSEALLACTDAHLPRSALHFATALAEAASRSSVPVEAAEAFTRRAAIRHSLGADGLAAEDLRAARGWIGRVPGAPWAGRALAEADATEGALLVRQRPEAAAQMLERALAYFEEAGPARLPALHLSLASAQAARGLDAEAEAELLDGIEAMERGRLALEDTALQASFFDQAAALFGEMVRLQVERHGDPERALAYVERGHGRQLLDALAGAGVAPLDPDALRRELPEGLALVYHLPLGDALYAWALTREGMQFVERPLPAAELSRLTAAQRAAIERRAPLDVLHRSAARLHDELVRPFMPFLGRRALVFVPDGVAQGVVFAALWNRDSGRYLVEDHLVAMAPSGSVCARASAAAARPLAEPPRALVVGNPRLDRRLWAGLPDLPQAEAEARAIAALYPGAELLTGAAATKATFVASSRRAHVVHFAGHAGAGASAPARLLLAADAASGESGALELRELEHAELPGARVVVLAACRTAAGPASRVEGALSLARPFLAAGVPGVVGSLWDVDDATSRAFFVEFHRALRLGGDAARALRSAQLAHLRGGDAWLAHPASWAAFVLMGGLDPHSSPKGELS